MTIKKYKLEKEDWVRVSGSDYDWRYVIKDEKIKQDSICMVDVVDHKTKICECFSYVYNIATFNGKMRLLSSTKPYLDINIKITFIDKNERSDKIWDKV